MDVYNPGGGIVSAGFLMKPMLRRFYLLSKTKPIAIPEFGTEFNYWLGGAYCKTKWMQDFFKQTKTYASIGMIVLFNAGMYEIQNQNPRMLCDPKIYLMALVPLW